MQNILGLAGLTAPNLGVLYAGLSPDNAKRLKYLQDLITTTILAPFRPPVRPPTQTTTVTKEPEVTVTEKPVEDL